MIIHLDFETRSPLDITKVGAYRYAEEAEILIMAFSFDDEEEVHVWDCVNGPPSPTVMMRLDDAITNGARVYAHNAQFEGAISAKCMLRDTGLPPPDIDQWFCTAAMARRAGMPAKLAKLAPALDLPESLWKNPRGTTLINHFSKMYSKSYRAPKDDPQEFKEFCEYCAQDVRVEKAVYQNLQSFDFSGGGMILDTYQIDQVINDRGVPVNIPAINEAIRVTSAYESRLSKRFREIVDLNPTQRDKFLQWANIRGYPGDNMQGVTIRSALDSGTLDDELAEALEIKEALGFAAVSKLVRMRDCACQDGRVRGTLQYYGAGTGRWSGRLIQPQNFKRPAFKDTPLVLQMLEDGQGDDIEFLWGNPQDAISSAIRHFLSLPDGQHINDVDFSSVEARIVCWLAGQNDALEEYKAGVDRYVRMASIIFGKPEVSISKDERWMGKTAVLGCGFQVGAKKFFEQATEDSEKYNIRGVVVTKSLCEATVFKWRKRHAKVVKFWYACDDAVREAIMRPNVVQRVGRHVQVKCQTDPHSGIKYLFIRLPSGRKLAYPHPKIDDSGTISYWGQIPMKALWGNVKLYGGKIVENITQAVAADLMALGAIRAHKAGHVVFSLIHDQILSEADSGTLEDLEDKMKYQPAWAMDLPIDVEGHCVPFYTKT